MKPTVLDTSAVLAMFFAEPGMETMRDLFHKASEADRPGELEVLPAEEKRDRGVVKIEAKKTPRSAHFADEAA